MLDKLFGPHINNVQRSLGQTTERQAILTANLANVNTPGYKRRDVQFGIELESAERKLGMQGVRNRMEPLRGPETGNVRLDGSSVNMEEEVLGIAETQMRYQMLTEIAGRYFSGLKSVINEGK